VTQPPDPYQQPDPYRGEAPGQGPSLDKQPASGDAPAPYQQWNAYGQAGPYQQPNPYGQAGTYQQSSPYGQVAPYQQQPWSGYPPQPAGPRNGLGTAGLVLGIVACALAWIPLAAFWIWPVPVLAIVFGAIGHNRANHGEATNKQSAMWGWILGIGSMVLSVVVTVVLYVVLLGMLSNSGSYGGGVYY
jgi:hypothetical protein